MKEGKIFIGGDHAGFETKEKLKKFFDQKGIEYEDLGPHKFVKADDYPDYSVKVGEAVATHKDCKGIVICGSGAGVVIAANKVKGIRAVTAPDVYTAKMSRLHNDANVLGLSGWRTPIDKIKKIVSVWLNTPFSNESRHKRRINKISKYENKR